MKKLKIGISSCLLGEKVRYDGSHKHDPYITDTLGKCFEWLPVCPEVESGLPIPREPMHLIGNPDSPRIITIFTGVDYTEKIMKWIKKKLFELENEDLCGFIFKSKSPCSGIRGVTVYTISGIPKTTGPGLFGGSFIKHFPLIPIIDDLMLHNHSLRKRFIESVFSYKEGRILR